MRLSNKPLKHFFLINELLADNIWTNPEIQSIVPFVPCLAPFVWNTVCKYVWSGCHLLNCKPNSPTRTNKWTWTWHMPLLFTSLWVIWELCRVRHSYDGDSGATKTCGSYHRAITLLLSPTHKTLSGLMTCFFLDFFLCFLQQNPLGFPLALAPSTNSCTVHPRGCSLSGS